MRLSSALRQRPERQNQRWKAFIGSPAFFVGAFALFLRSLIHIVFHALPLFGGQARRLFPAWTRSRVGIRRQGLRWRWVELIGVERGPIFVGMGRRVVRIFRHRTCYLFFCCLSSTISGGLPDDLSRDLSRSRPLRSRISCFMPSRCSGVRWPRAAPVGGCGRWASAVFAA